MGVPGWFAALRSGGAVGAQTAAGLATTTAPARPALAQGEWPQRSIRMIPPFLPGGAADLPARALAVELTPILRQSVVVENRTGAGGSVGTEAAARSPPDGYTMVMGSTGPMAINPSLIRLSYDPARDLVPMVPVAAVASVLVVHPSVNARTLPGLLALPRAEPGRLNCGSSGIGSAQHLFMELLKQQANADITHIPNRRTGPAMVDTVGGRLTMMFDTTPTALPHIRDGRVRAIAVAAGRRDPALPEVPTIGETVPGYEALGWYGILAPTGTPAEFTALIARDRDRWGEVIRRGNIRVD